MTEQKIYFAELQNLAIKICEQINCLGIEEKVQALNFVRLQLHEISPFKSEPVDLVQWVKNSSVHANDYNPNSVAPPEMELLRVSIDADGYTQPIVAMTDQAGYEVIDGFHRHRVGKEFADITNRVHGYLPIVQIRASQADKSDRMASTIRHNRARGKHKVEAMSDIVIELKRRNWSDEKIAKNLGMDADEVLRLCQITGLAEAFKDQVFSEAWEVNNANDMSAEVFSDVFENLSVNDKSRIYHTWEKWECYQAGFYAERCLNMSVEEGEQKYKEFLSDLRQFESALQAVVTTWKYSCEHYLTNDRMNRIAWLGQASVAYALGIPSVCRGGYHLLNDLEKMAADNLALKYLNIWLSNNGREQVDFDAAGGRTQAELY